MKEGFFYLLLHPDYHSITTFASHIGLFKCKCLNYGACSASEKYKAEIQRLVQGIPGAKNLADNIVVYGINKAQHDTRLVKLLESLENSGLTLNGDKW